MATNRGLTGWRRREAMKDSAERRDARRQLVLSDDARDNLAYWRQAEVEHVGFVYFILDRADDAVKIGWAMSPGKRLIELQVGNPRLLHIASVLYGTPTAEYGYQELWQESFVRGEWFSGASQIIEWSLWAADVQRAQFERGEVGTCGFQSTYGKHPSDWRKVAA